MHSKYITKRRYTKKINIGFLLASLLFSSLETIGQTATEEQKTASTQIVNPTHYQTSKSAWALAFDNDILVPGSRDQDYTYGINLTYVGKKSHNHWASLHDPLRSFDNWVGITGNQGTISSSKIEYGLFGFTPEDISQPSLEAGDRPYASLIYVSSTNEYYDPSQKVSWISTLSVGALGLNLVGELQKFIHKSTGSDEPLGWDQQISQGGELTARYNIARQQLLGQSGGNSELKSTIQASVGYITEASWSISGRIGKINTPWVSFNPGLTNYGEKSAPTPIGSLPERYFWAGVAVKIRAYNAFLQGQFRDSALEYETGELRHHILEAWTGYTIALRSGYRFTYSLRGHTSELKQGVGDRNVIWGGIQVTRIFG